MHLPFSTQPPAEPVAHAAALLVATAAAWLREGVADWLGLPEHAADLLALLPCGVVVRALDGRAIVGNAAALQQLRLSRAQLVSEQPSPAGWGKVHGDGRPKPADEWPSARALALGESLHGQLVGVVAAGEAVCWLQVSVAPIRDAQGLPAGTVSCYTDVSDQRDRQSVLEHIVDAAGLGTWRWDMRDGTMLCNDRLLSVLGYRRGEVGLTQRAWAALAHPDSRIAWRQALVAHLRNPDTPCRAELRIRRPDGDWATVQTCGMVIARAADGSPLRMAGIDMTEQVQMQSMLRHAARTGGLTQLPNRAAMFEQVQLAVDRARQQPGFAYAVLFMDFDRFKQTNDTLGHAAGDEWLRQIAQRLRSALRAGDTLTPGASRRLRAADAEPAARGAVDGAAGAVAGRIGGDEFVVVLDAVHSRDEACAVARRLMDVLAAPYRIAGQVVHPTASIGIVTSENPANDANTVMRDADTAMYEAKRAGRGRYMVFDPTMHERVARGVAIEADLRLALRRCELFVVYQPVVELQAAGPGGVEALVRWQHPVRGLVSPLDFIGVAEESGLIVELGLFVLRTACRQFVAWQATLGAAAPVSLAVNLSPVQLRMAGLIGDVQRCLADTGIAPAALQFEVTESLAAQDETARERLRELKALGLRIALDDFGTGYSSLACLHQLPVDTVKIDKSFVSHAETSDYHRVLIEATIRVAQTLGMNTVAEGIETASQAALLQKLQCGRGQGFHWARPLTADALADWQLQCQGIRRVA